jgi:ketosteroid isomerase-like protein
MSNVQTSEQPHDAKERSMTTTETTEAQLRDLGKRWAEAEQRGDTAALEDLSADEFVLVGPAGFVLDRSQWLHRYEGGDLVTYSLDWDELTIRDFGDTAVVVGRHTQRAAYRGNPADGSFRATHIAVRRDRRWRLAGIHLSPIGGPPPFAPQAR